MLCCVEQDLADDNVGVLEGEWCCIVVMLVLCYNGVEEFVYEVCLELVTYARYACAPGTSDEVLRHLVSMPLYVQGDD